MIPMKVVLQHLTKKFPSRNKKSNAEVIAVKRVRDLRPEPV